MHEAVEALLELLDLGCHLLVAEEQRGVGKVDHELSKNSHLATRYFLFKNFSLSNIGGGLNTISGAPSARCRSPAPTV